jgi:rubrerythrin
MATVDNLKAAFAGESQANRKYTAFAKKAEAEGFPQIAKLFRAAGEAETVHAHSHLRVLKGVGKTDENLQVAIDGEGYEFQKMYPEFIKEAEAEGNKAAVITFKGAMAAEQIHFKFYSEALASFKSGKDLPQVTYHVCQICGHTVAGAAPDKCPVCNAPKDKFVEVR